jgi:hypothetical protein
LWDQLAVVSLTNPEVVTWERHCIEIILDMENHEGQTNSTDTGCNNVDVAISADVELFEDLFVGYINDDLPTSTTTESGLDFLTNPYVLIIVGGGLVCFVLVVFVILRRK